MARDEALESLSTSATRLIQSDEKQAWQTILRDWVDSTKWSGRPAIRFHGETSVDSAGIQLIADRALSHREAVAMSLFFASRWFRFVFAFRAFHRRKNEASFWESRAILRQANRGRENRRRERELVIRRWHGCPQLRGEFDRPVFRAPTIAMCQSIVGIASRLSSRSPRGG